VAWSDHWRGVLMPTGAQPPSTVTYRLQRVMTSLTTCAAVQVRSVDTMALGEARARWITSQHPAEREGVRARARPQGGASAALLFAAPTQGTRLPDRMRSLEDLFQCRQAKALDAGTTDHMPYAFWRWRDASTASRLPVVTSVAC
jgi:hypothetical protein